jgi:predicted DNA-binding ribbon-helix-helix protein
MKPVHFDPEKDRAPLPFDDRICRQALQMKAAGLKWRPHVGCFVWDPENHIQQDSPFPNRIYFVLSIARFIEIFGEIENMVEKLVWLPTWHQARLLCTELNVPGGAGPSRWQANEALSPDEELVRLYGVIMDALIEKNFAAFIGQATRLDKISIAALIGRMGDISAWPVNFTSEVLRVYHQFIEAYLNILRQQENKPPDWFPRYLSIDPELADGMRHFYSDSQHITRKFFKLNQELDLLRTIDKDNQSRLFQDKIDEILALCTE